MYVSKRSDFTSNWCPSQNVDTELRLVFSTLSRDSLLIFTFDKSKLSDVVAVIGGVDDVGVLQLTHLN